MILPGSLIPSDKYFLKNLTWPRKEFDWNGDVATRVDMRTTKVKFFKIYLCEGMSDPDKSIRPGKMNVSYLRAADEG